LGDFAVERLEDRAHIPEDAILDPVRQLTLRSALAGVVGLLVLVFLVTAIARRFTRPS